MSRHVSSPDKAVRIIGFSLYLALVIAAISLFFRSFEFSTYLFLASSIYFILLFAILAITKNIHFNILMSRKSLRKAKALYKSEFHLARLRHFSILFKVIIVFLAFSAAVYIYKEIFALAVITAILGLVVYLYFYVHKIRLYAINEGIVFDYGEFIVLLRWGEIKSYEIRKNHVIVHLKEKNIRRGFYVENPEKLGKILKKFIK